MGKKRAWLAALLSFIFPGLGQIYNGRILRGIFMAIMYTIVLVLMAATTIIAVYYYGMIGLVCILGFIIPVFMWLWSIYDAYKKAKKINASLVAPTQPVH